MKKLLIHLLLFFEIQKIAIELFNNLTDKIEEKVINIFRKVNNSSTNINLKSLKINVPLSTWTYLISDNPFENQLSIQLGTNIGFLVSADILDPLMTIFYF